MNRDNFVYFRAPTLPHLMALIARPPKNFLPPETCLIVVDSVSSVFPPYFPSVTEIRNHFAVNKKTDKLHLQWLLNRKWNVAGELATHLNRFAARNIAVLTISQSHLKFNGKSKPSLQPIFLGEAWKTNVKTRIALYRDLPHERLACVEKRAGKLLVSKTEDLNVAFRIRPVCHYLIHCLGN